MKRKSENLAIINSGLDTAVPETEDFDFFVGKTFFEYDIQNTADTVNTFPLIAQGYPVSGIKDTDKKTTD